MRCGWGCGREATQYVDSEWVPAACDHHGEASTALVRDVVRLSVAMEDASGAPTWEHERRVMRLCRSAGDASGWVLW